MDEISLVAQIDSNTTVYVSPVHDETYSEFVENDILGGPEGYFIAREFKNNFEILAKASNLDAAKEIFFMLTAQNDF